MSDSFSFVARDADDEPLASVLNDLLRLLDNTEELLMSEQTTNMDEWQDALGQMKNQQTCPFCQRRCPCCGRPWPWGPWYRYPEYPYPTYPPYYVSTGTSPDEWSC